MAWILPYDFTIGKGNESPHAGAKIAIGHGLFEIPLMIAIFYGFGSLLNHIYVKAGIGIIGGALLFWMGLGMLKNLNNDNPTVIDGRSPTAAGIFLTMGNPYFLVWWATVGAFLVLRAVEFGILGFILFAVIHWLCDLVWLYFLSALSFKGGAFFGKKFQRIVFIICGTFLILFSGKFFWDALHIMLKHDI